MAWVIYIHNSYHVTWSWMSHCNYGWPNFKVNILSATMAEESVCFLWGKRDKKGYSTRNSCWFLIIFPINMAILGHSWSISQGKFLPKRAPPYEAYASLDSQESSFFGDSIAPGRSEFTIGFPIHNPFRNISDVLGVPHSMKPPFVPWSKVGW